MLEEKRLYVPKQADPMDGAAMESLLPYCLLDQKVNPAVNPARGYECERCNFSTDKKSNYTAHLVTKKHLLVNPSVYTCDICSFTTSKKSNWNEHIATKKHNLLCSRCDVGEIDGITHHVIETVDIAKLLERNNELQEQLIALLMKRKKKGGAGCGSGSSGVNNIHHYLETKCKDAISLTDFLDRIKFGIETVEIVADMGYVNGLAKIICEELNKLDVYQRPIHCTDVKRKVVYVKDNNKWIRDFGGIMLISMIEKAGNRNVKCIKKWQSLHPEYDLLDAPDFMRYMEIVRENVNIFENNNVKIMKLICDVIYILRSGD